MRIRSILLLARFRILRGWGILPQARGWKPQSPPLGYALLGVALGVSLIGCADTSKTITTSGTNTKSTDANERRLPESVSGDAGYTFATPVRLSADGEPISVESPGYACPTMADVDQDGTLDLVVGQFNQGSMQLFKNEAGTSSSPNLIAVGWLQTDDKRAIVPGVW